MMERRRSVHAGLAWSFTLLFACSDDASPNDGAQSAAGSSTAGTSAAASGTGAGSVATAGAGATSGRAGSPAQPMTTAGAPSRPMMPTNPNPMPAAGGGAAPMMPAAGSGMMPAAGGGAPMMPMPPGNPPMMSPGCGAMGSPPSGPQTIDVDGTMREYITRIPANYDASKPYKLVFAWHGLGGTAMQIAGGFGGGFYGLATRAMDGVIFVAGQGLPTGGGMGGMATGGAGWPNTGGRDVAFVRKLVEWVTTKYCVDMTRIFSVGMSYGGIMSNTLGCEMGDVFRAIAPMAGSGPRTFGGRMCTGQVAAWLSHGNMDTVVTFASGEGSRNHWVMSNHCTMETQPVGMNGCLAYQGCDEGHPVVWCEFAGGHTVPQFASQSIWEFFSQF